jgi:putative ABC transport system permease protein
MSPLQILRIAMRAMSRNTMRSFLTMLGVIIGVGAVIAMVAIGEGAKSRVEASFAAMGTNLLVLMPGATNSGGASSGFGAGPTLTWEDLTAIRTELPSVKSAAPSLGSTVQIVSEEQNWFTRVTGTSPEYFEARNWPCADGALFTQSDLDTGAKVVVLGATVAAKLFGPSARPLGLTVRIKNIPFTVIGVAAKKGQSPTGQDYDDTAFIPYTTLQQKIQGSLKKYLTGTVFIAAQSTASLAETEAAVVALLRERHHLAPGDDDDFSIRSLTELASAQAEGTKTLTLLLASVAAVSLLVGGIGIMNIMLVSVTERTREIGVRMAIGAKPRHILAQFLAEALVLSSLGGVVGIALGVVVSTRIATSFGWPTLIRPEITLIAVGFSAAVGVVFGLYPARKASRLDPIHALRFE